MQRIGERGQSRFLVGIRAMLRGRRALQRFVLWRRQRRAERRYLQLREAFVRAGTTWLDWPAQQRRDRELLHRAWRGPVRLLPAPTDARIFVVVGELETTMNLAPELGRSFDTEVFNYVDYLPRRLQPHASLDWRERLQTDLLARFRAAHERRPFDLAILYVTHFECARSTLGAITATGVPAAVLCWDDKHSLLEQPVGWPNGQEPLIGAATLHLTNSLECVSWYAARGAAARYFPEAADPETYRHIDLQKDISVSFIGGWYGARRELIRELHTAGVEVRCWGPGTEGGAVSREEMVRIYNRSRVNLGFGGLGDTGTVTHLKGRDFEIPMTGNLYLTLYDYELAHHFDVGREILCYLNGVDCVEQIRFWLSQEDGARAVGQAARERALRDHTWTRRVSDLLAWMGLAPGPLQSEQPPGIR